MRVAQAVPQVRAVPNVKREVVGTLACHQVDTGASRRSVSLKVTALVEHEQVEYSPRGCWVPQLLAKGHGAVEAFPSHETQRLAPRAKSQVPRDARYWCTYRRHPGNAGPSPVSSHKRAPPARATNPETGGRLTQAPAGTNPKTGQAAVIFLTTTVSSSSGKSGLSWCPRSLGWTSSGMPAWCWRSQARLPQEQPRCVGGRGDIAMCNLWLSVASVFTCVSFFCPHSRPCAFLRAGPSSERTQ